jgi:mannose-6-phosphate isomerase-like protein (cupin superfamily)
VAATAVDAGVLRISGSIANSAVAINNGGTLGGSGTIGSVALSSGATIAPGMSPGTLSNGAQTWAGGTSYFGEINKANGTKGGDPGWDFLSISGALTVNATSGSKFNISLTSLTLANESGQASSFDNTQNYAWTIATASGGIVEHRTSFKMHSHEYSELTMVLGGRGLHVTDYESYPLEEGDVFVINGNTRHGFKDPQNLRLCDIMYDPRQFFGGNRDLCKLMGFHALFDLRSVQPHPFKNKLHLSADEMFYVTSLLRQSRLGPQSGIRFRQLQHFPLNDTRDRLYPGCCRHCSECLPMPGGHGGCALLFRGDGDGLFGQPVWILERGPRGSRGGKRGSASF